MAREKILVRVEDADELNEALALSIGQAMCLTGKQIEALIAAFNRTASGPERNELRLRVNRLFVKRRGGLWAVNVERTNRLFAELRHERMKALTEFLPVDTTKWDADAERRKRRYMPPPPTSWISEPAYTLTETTRDRKVSKNAGQRTFRLEFDYAGTAPATFDEVRGLPKMREKHPDHPDWIVMRITKQPACIGMDVVTVDYAPDSAAEKPTAITLADVERIWKEPVRAEITVPSTAPTEIVRDTGPPPTFSIRREGFDVKEILNDDDFQAFMAMKRDDKAKANPLKDRIAATKGQPKEQPDKGSGLWRLSVWVLGTAATALIAWALQRYGGGQ